jgi:type I restriction enzyme R subunit
MTTDTTEKGLEALIVAHMTSEAGGWIAGSPADYDRAYAVDLAQLRAFTVFGLTYQDSAA